MRKWMNKWKFFPNTLVYQAQTPDESAFVWVFTISSEKMPSRDYTLFIKVSNIYFFSEKIVFWKRNVRKKWAILLGLICKSPKRFHSFLCCFWQKFISWTFVRTIVYCACFSLGFPQKVKNTLNWGRCFYLIFSVYSLW
jgi:hypothetical protein